MPQVIATLDQPYVTMGVAWVEEFIAQQNIDRAIFGLPPVLFMGSDALSLTRLQAVDIAQIHSEHEAAILFQTHDSGLLPVGWQTTAERINKVTPLSGSENLLLSSFFHYAARTFNDITPLDAYAAWWASPLHKAILLWDYGSGGVPVYSTFGVAVSDAASPEFSLPYGTVSSIFLTNNFLQLEAVTMEAILSQSWESIGCTIGLLDQEYQIFAYAKVKVSHEATYRATVNQYLTSPYSCGVAAEHTTQTHYGVSTSVDSPYVGTVPIPPTFCSSLWDTRMEVVSKAFESLYPLRLVASIGAGYEDSPRLVSAMTIPYESSPPVTAYLTAEYRANPTVRSSVQAMYSDTPPATAAMESSYGASAMVRAYVLSLYEPSQMVSASLDALYGRYSLISAYTESPYEHNAKLSASSISWYTDLNRLHSGMDSPYSSATRLVAAEVSTYTGNLVIRSSNVASSYLPSSVHNSNESVFDIRIRDKVITSCETRYAMGTDGALLDTRSTFIIHNGVSTRVSDGYVSTAVGNPGYQFEVQVADIQVYSGIHILDHITLDFSGEIYELVVTGKSMTRNSPASIDATISGLSPVYLKDLPYSDQITYTPTTSKMMSEIVQEVLGQPVAWEVVDWLIPVGRAQTASGTPLGFVKTLLASVLASIQSNPDGSLVARYNYPTNWDTLKSISITHEIEEVADILSLTIGYEYRKGFNRFHIKDSDTEFRDTIEWDQETEIATVTPYPYRSSWTLSTTAVSGINIQDLGEDTATITDLVEFKGGVGTLSKPIITMVSMVWLSADLGSTAFDPYSTQVQCGVTVNQGYGLAKITYLSKSYKFNVTSPTAVEAAQLVVKEN